MTTPSFSWPSQVGDLHYVDTTTVAGGKTGCDTIIDAVLTLTYINHIPIIAKPTEEIVEACTTIQNIIAITAVQQINPDTAREPVITCFTKQGIVAAISIQDIISCATVDKINIFAAVDSIIPSECTIAMGIFTWLHFHCAHIENIIAF
jgi:hypothetical protein